MSNLEIKNSVELIKNEPYLKKVISKHSITDEEIENNIFVFEEAFNSLQLCRNCTGIENCPQRVKGEVYTVGYNGVPYSVIRYCRHVAPLNRLDSLRSRYVYTDIPKSMLSLNLDNITCLNEWQQLLFKPLYDIANQERNKGVYIYGGFGVGKTYFASALANTLVAKGYKVVFAKCNPFVTDMYTLMMNDANEFESLLKRIKEADYVIIDDIGTENVTSFSRDRLLYNIFEYRMDNNLCTIFTSNFDIDSLEVRFNQISDPNSGRICERIRTLADEIILKGVNQRRHD